MRKLVTILALLGLAVGVSALDAHADGVVDYTVSGVFGPISGVPSTSLSNAGDSFTLTFSVNSTALVSNGFGMSLDITTPFVYTDITTPSLSLDGSGTVNFFTACSPSPCPPQINNGGLFSLLFTGPNGNTFMFDLFGTDAGFIDGTPPILNTNAGGPPFTIGDGSIFGEAMPDNTAVGENSVSGTVTATAVSTPEPSSLLLLGSGFLALGGFARKRLIARFN
jgi:PEP-CTERM motif-containing protein